jgi:nucleotide-binding universal stress UspA family protein
VNRAATILAATDFSAYARLAADRAARIASDESCALALLHVVPGETLSRLRAWLGEGSAPERQLADEASAQLQDLAHELRAVAGAPVETSVVSGGLPDEMLREAERRDARLIVVGARGAGFARRLVLGTTAERLMRRTARPLLVVRQQPRERYRRVLVAVDFSEWSAPALVAARWVAPRADVVLMTAFEVPYEGKLRQAGIEEAVVLRYRERARAEASQRLRALATAAGLRDGDWEPCVVEGEPSARIVETERDRRCDLVAIGKHGTPLAVDLLLGSVTQHLLAEGAADMLISTRRERADA